jgi:hypothetical protein
MTKYVRHLPCPPNNSIDGVEEGRAHWVWSQGYKLEAHLTPGHHLTQSVLFFFMAKIHYFSTKK